MASSEIEIVLLRQKYKGMRMSCRIVADQHQFNPASTYIPTIK